MITFATSSITTLASRPITCRTTEGSKCRMGSSSTTSGGSGSCFGSFLRIRVAFTSSGCSARHFAHARWFLDAWQASRPHTRWRFPTRGSTSNQRRQIAQGRVVAIGYSSGASPVARSGQIRWGWDGSGQAGGGGPVLESRPGPDPGSGEARSPWKTRCWDSGRFNHAPVAMRNRAASVSPRTRSRARVIAPEVGSDWGFPRFVRGTNPKLFSTSTMLMPAKRQAPSTIHTTTSAGILRRRTLIPSPFWRACSIHAGSIRSRMVRASWSGSAL